MTPAEQAHPYLHAASAGVATGMRGTSAMTAIALAARRGDMRFGDGRLGRLLAARPVLPALCLAAAGELVADKLPMTPSRLEPGPLLGRMVSGGVTGAIVSRGWGGAPVAGGVAGAVASLASSWVFGKGRARIGSITGLPDPVVAIGEDVLAIAFAALATSAPRFAAESRGRRSASRSATSLADRN